MSLNFIPLILFIYGIIELFREYKKLSNEKDFDGNSYGFWTKIERLAYWFNGKDIVSKEIENVIEDEPSVKRFKEYFTEIVNDLDRSKGQGLVLIFDNMDRLSSDQKVMSLWSSIHTFFAENTHKDIWVLIPYDREHLANFFERSERGQVITHEFISKTFTLSFRIAPPVISDWKYFFNLKLKEAFGENFFDDKNKDEKYFLETIFDYSTVGNINPRQIITYLNSIIALYKQWGDRIFLRYLAVFVIKRNDILNNPLDVISSNSYLGVLKSLFYEDEDIQRNISALVFNVDIDKADEILLKREIEQIFVNVDKKRAETISSHPAFISYFDKVFQEQVNNNSAILHKIAEILELYKNIIETNQYYTYWKSLCDEIYRKIFNDEMYNKEFQYIHKALLTNTQNIKGKPFQILKEFIEKRRKKSLKTDGKVNLEYYELLNVIDDFLIDLNDGESLSITELISNQVLSPEDLIKIVTEQGNYFTEFKLTSQINELNQYLIADVKHGVIPVDDNKTILEILVEANSKQFFNQLFNHITAQLQEVQYHENDKISMLLTAQKILNPDKPLKKTLPFGTALNHLVHIKKDAEIFPTIVNILISHLGTNDISNSEFTNVLDNTENIKSHAKDIENYITYGDLLKLIIEKGKKNILLKEIVQDLSINSYGVSSQAISWVFKNIDKISNEIYSGALPNHFFKKIDLWEKSFGNDINAENIFSNVNESMFRYISSDPNQDFKCLRFILKLAIENFTNKSTTNWLNCFEKDDRDFKIFMLLYDKQQISNKITKSSEFMQAYEEYIYRFIEGETTGDNASFLNKLVEDQKINVNSLKRIYNNVLDRLLHHNHTVTLKEIDVLSVGLFNYSSNILSKADEVQRKIILPLLKDSNLGYNIVEKNIENIINIINKSDAYIHDIIEAIGVNFTQESESLKSLIEKTKIGEMTKKITETETEKEVNEE